MTGTPAAKPRAAQSMPTFALCVNRYIANAPSRSAGCLSSYRAWRSSSVAGGGRPALRVVLADQRVEAVGIRRGQAEAGHRAQDQQGGRQRQLPAQRAHRRREALAHEAPRGLPGGALGAVDADVRARRQALQVLEHVRVQRDGARHAERGEGRAVEDRQPAELRGAQRWTGPPPRRVRSGTRAPSTWPRAPAELEATSHQLPPLDVEVAVDEPRAQAAGRGLDALGAQAAKAQQDHLALAQQVAGHHRAVEAREVGAARRRPSPPAPGRAGWRRGRGGGGPAGPGSRSSARR